ncbi:SAF domain-containing protein [Lacisediminihabitans sp. H27-G8]|uniref:SAF domain-containing protein n=1 Tax=Lacisediminihabitans sp. H27-G8 TaxID=3111909 RepID=UPI0038FD10C9
MAGATALILVGGLLSVFLYTSLGHPDEVFAVSHTIPRGTTITADDLTSLALASGQRSPAISTSTPSEVIGKVTTVDLPKGSLVTPAAIAATEQIPMGRALVGLSLKPSQLPAERLVAGNRVEIVPIASNTIGDASVTTSTIPGVVFETSINQQSGTTIVDVYVSETVAADLTGRAAAGTVAIYLTGANG